MARRPDAAPPLKPAEVHILLALAGHDAHGYAIMQSVREQSNGEVPLRTGSFYRHLSRLIDHGYVAESSADRPADDDPRRGAYYTLTARGHRVLVQERARLAALVAALDALRPAPRRGGA
ncbi:MAG TPA: PadR family transcriptional regulator [Vicinamibacterales bacterium]|nr:PadR family transcriptional regulator [Vicinamibacterales bacterium]